MLAWHWYTAGQVPPHPSVTDRPKSGDRSKSGDLNASNSIAGGVSPNTCDETASVDDRGGGGSDDGEPNIGSKPASLGTASLPVVAAPLTATTVPSTSTATEITTPAGGEEEDSASSLGTGATPRQAQQALVALKSLTVPNDGDEENVEEDNGVGGCDGGGEDSDVSVGGPGDDVVGKSDEPETTPITTITTTNNSTAAAAEVISPPSKTPSAAFTIPKLKLVLKPPSSPSPRHSGKWEGKTPLPGGRGGASAQSNGLTSAGSGGSNKGGGAAGKGRGLKLVLKRTLSGGRSGGAAGGSWSSSAADRGSEARASPSSLASRAASVVEGGGLGSGSGKKRARQERRKQGDEDDGYSGLFGSGGGSSDGGGDDDDDDDDGDDYDDDDGEGDGRALVGRGGKRRARPLGSRLRAIARLGDDAAAGGSEDENSADEYKPDADDVSQSTHQSIHPLINSLIPTETDNKEITHTHTYILGIVLHPSQSIHPRFYPPHLPFNCEVRPFHVVLFLAS